MNKAQDISQYWDEKASKPAISQADWSWRRDIAGVGYSKIKLSKIDRRIDAACARDQAPSHMGSLMSHILTSPSILSTFIRMSENGTEPVKQNLMYVRRNEAVGAEIVCMKELKPPRRKETLIGD